ncbi:MAG: DUF2461 domain-containing protein, partial [Bacteroidetes bacterium]|nr:DUF2461 domain-containing protein [Bacteroidota bacterium]
MDLKKTISFLSTLKDNNHKEWFDIHRSEWDTIRKDLTLFIDEVIVDIAKFDPNVNAIKAKDCIFRINKDIRFSKDKSPYKTNIGASISKEGRKSIYAGYYVHIEPNNFFVA